MQKKVDDFKSKYEQISKDDLTMIQEMSKTLDQAKRNAVQGEMGRALAVSKLSVIKNTVENLEKKLKDENQALMDEANAMLQKHQPSILEEAPVTSMSQKANQGWPNSIKSTSLKSHWKFKTKMQSWHKHQST